MKTSSIFLTLATSLSTAVAQYKGFNYANTFTNGTAKVTTDFKNEFTIAQSLVGTSGFTSARIYTLIQADTTSDLIQALPAAVSTNTTLLIGLWASVSNDSFQYELDALSYAINAFGTELTDLIVGIAVGSEDLYRISPTGIANDAGVGTGPDTIVDYIKQVRSITGSTVAADIPVGHVDTWTAWVNTSNSDVITNSDFIGVDAYPYFQTTMDNGINQGKTLFDDALSQVNEYASGKDIWITETGWPVSGSTENLAVAGLANAKTYWDEVGCSLFGSTNTWWYTLQDAAGGTVDPSFGVIGSDLSTTPLFDLSCSGSSSSAATGSDSSAIAASVSREAATVSKVSAPSADTGSATLAASNAPIPGAGYETGTLASGRTGATSVASSSSASSSGAFNNGAAGGTGTAAGAGVGGSAVGSATSTYAATYVGTFADTYAGTATGTAAGSTLGSAASALGTRSTFIIPTTAIPSTSATCNCSTTFNTATSTVSPFSSHATFTASVSEVDVTVTVVQYTTYCPPSGTTQLISQTTQISQVTTTTTVTPVETCSCPVYSLESSLPSILTSSIAPSSVAPSSVVTSNTTSTIAPSSTTSTLTPSSVTPSSTTSTPTPSSVTPSSTSSTLTPSSIAPSSTPSTSSASSVVTTSTTSTTPTSNATSTVTSTTTPTSSCPADLPSNYEYPHLIVLVNSSAPSAAFDTGYFGEVSSTVSSLFNFDIPASDSGKTCSLVFLFPDRSQLETSDYTISGSGGIVAYELSSTITQNTTYNSVPSKTEIGSITSLTSGSSYTLSTFSCPAGEAVSFGLTATGSLNLNYFQDYNPCPIGLFITVS